MIGGRKDNGNMFQKTVQVEVFSGKCDFFCVERKGDDLKDRACEHG